jgi:glutamate--cysteine ligase
LLESRLSWLQDETHADLIRRGLRGIEKECLRVALDGSLSMRQHPQSLGAALTHPYLTTDYSEALLEFVTPAYPTNWETFQFLCDSHSFVNQNLDDEILWAQSMPCMVDPERNLPIARYGQSNLGQMKTIYRRGLGYRYGRAMQAIAGIHYNYSLPIAFWDPYGEHLENSHPRGQFISEQYMGLIRNYRRMAWLFLYLFGASPAVCKSFCPEGGEILQELTAGTWYGPHSTSLRMSDIGYRNKTQAGLKISVNSLAEYTDGLASAVMTPSKEYEGIGIRVEDEYRQLSANVLQIENEYYSAIRPKPAPAAEEPPVARLRAMGVEYIEVRTLDLNMLDPVGINQNQLRFAEAAMIRCLLTDSPPISPGEQAEIDARELLVAREGRKPGLALPMNGGVEDLQEAALKLMDEILMVASVLDGEDQDCQLAVQAQRASLLDSSRTPSAQIIANLRSSGLSFFEFGLETSKTHAQYFQNLGLSEEKAALFGRAAEDSLERARLLEQRREPPFEIYLESYFAKI